MDTRFPFSPAEVAKVRCVQFGILSPDEIRQMSVTQIEHSETMERGKPKPGGLSDPRLGTIDRKMKCETCTSNMAECPGHFGHLELAKPMFHIGFLKTVLAIMRCVCFNCSKILADEEDARFKQAMRIRNPKHRLKKIYEACKGKKKCEGGDDIDEQGQQDLDEPVKKGRGGCGSQQPNITIDGMKMVAEYKAVKKKSDDQEQLPLERRMKFGKRLKQQMEETLPEWRDKFLSYKDLKKLVRLISSVDNLSSQHDAEAHFLRCLDSEINKFNSFFIEQEEDFIIRQKLLKERIESAVDAPKMGRVQKDIVNFHGEMVLLENYSSINYTGLAKILKKYDKRTGGLLRIPFIEKVLKQPFFTTEILTKLIDECEMMMGTVFIAPPREERGAIAATAGPGIFRNTVVALETMHELRKGSSTYSHFSLPPLSLPDADLLQSLKLPSPIPIQ